MDSACLYALLTMSGHAPDESADVVLGDAHLDLGQGDMMASQWHQSFINEAFVIQELPIHSGDMRPGIVLHQEEPKSHCTSVRSDNHSEVFILLPKSSQDTVGYDMVVCATLQGNASQDHH